ncbi:hypothetical protein FQZ97_997990 [compost metagenome]
MLVIILFKAQHAAEIMFSKAIVITEQEVIRIAHGVIRIPVSSSLFQVSDRFFRIFEAFSETVFRQVPAVILILPGIFIIIEPGFKIQAFHNIHISKPGGIESCKLILSAIGRHLLQYIVFLSGVRVFTGPIHPIINGGNSGKSL